MVLLLQLSINKRIGCSVTEKYFSLFDLFDSWLTTALTVPPSSPYIDISLEKGNKKREGGRRILLKGEAMEV